MSENRIITIDALRGIAALSVFFYHVTYGYDYGLNQLSNNHFYFIYGKYGVELFFIISGFVIFMTLNKLKSIKLFFINRISRLYPTYWTCIFITIIITRALNRPFEPFSLEQILVNLTMLQKWLKIPSIDGVYWSLGVELMFYFFIAIIFYFKLENLIIRIGTILLCFSFLLTAINIPYIKGIRNVLILNYWPLFFSGIIFFNIKKRFIVKSKALILLIASWLIQIFILLNDTKDSEYGIIFAMSFVYLLFILFVFPNWKNPMLFRFFSFFGLFSYPFYLLHQEISYSFLKLIRPLFNNQIAELVILLLISLLLSLLVHNQVELKFTSGMKSLLFNFQDKITLKIMKYWK